ncbi:unnamed protein product [Medioppia subpectinata]|uniref:C-type lectin domain-containing protein n=1 Tax=Medioppia subpectinata TaxID=1979941 RepID=A0A7R9Q415_9ACAR|nr:unnamed protein product [Medioppia subpectinata]CAG2112100.1 unnamed protein product [Medioppia subpectinata]
MVESVWLDASIENKHIVWKDGTRAVYENWLTGRPVNDSNCVEMLPDQINPGQWLDQPCAKRNIVACKRVVKWLDDRTERLIRDNRRLLVRYETDMAQLKQTVAVLEVTAGEVRPRNQAVRIFQLHGTCREPCGCNGWVPYGDEKCYRVFNTTHPKTYAQSGEFCGALKQDPYVPTLPIVKSADEHRFLVDYLADTFANGTDVWIGARRRTSPADDVTEFKWWDGSSVEYSNWLPGAALGVDRADCVAMKSAKHWYAVSGAQVVDNGVWVNTMCDAHNVVLCQKVQYWSDSKIQSQVMADRRRALQTRHDLDTFKNMLDVTANNSATKNIQDEILNEIATLKRNQEQQQAEITQLKLDDGHHQSTITQLKLEHGQQQSEISELKHEYELRKSENTQLKLDHDKQQTEISKLQQDVNQCQSKIAQVSQSQLPIGFIYVQLPHQSDPKDLWPQYTWSEVTAQYAGQFFRAEGAGSLTYNQGVQPDNAPRITKIAFRSFRDGGDNWEVDVPSSGWSPLVITGGHSGRWVLAKYYVSGGEVRPRNQAVRIFKRTG